MNSSRTARLTLAAVASAVALAGAVTTAANAAGANSTEATEEPRPFRATVAADLAQVRAATTKYHDVDQAIADGYIPTDVCTSSPAGAMGHHYVNPGLIGAPVATSPTVLLYLPGADGLELAGVEYLQWDADQDESTFGDRPTLFGRGFDGPMEGHEPGMPMHYDLHVWLWKHNPDGMFAAFNPAASC